MCMYSLMNWLLYLVNLTSVFSRNKDLFSFISRPWYKENIERQRITCTAQDLGECERLLFSMKIIEEQYVYSKCLTMPYLPSAACARPLLLLWEISFYKLATS